MNAKQVQAWLGHHAASFTLDVYVHLLPDDVGEEPPAFDRLAHSDEEQFSTSIVAFGTSPR